MDKTYANVMESVAKKKAKYESRLAEAHRRGDRFAINTNQRAIDKIASYENKLFETQEANKPKSAPTPMYGKGGGVAARNYFDSMFGPNASRFGINPYTGYDDPLNAMGNVINHYGKDTQAGKAGVYYAPQHKWANSSDWSNVNMQPSNEISTPGKAPIKAPWVNDSVEGSYMPEEVVEDIWANGPVNEGAIIQTDPIAKNPSIVKNPIIKNPPNPATPVIAERPKESFTKSGNVGLKSLQLNSDGTPFDRINRAIGDEELQASLNTEFKPTFGEQLGRVGSKLGDIGKKALPYLPYAAQFLPDMYALNKLNDLEGPAKGEVGLVTAPNLNTDLDFSAAKNAAYSNRVANEKNIDQNLSNSASAVAAKTANRIGADKTVADINMKEVNMESELRNKQAGYLASARNQNAANIAQRNNRFRQDTIDFNNMKTNANVGIVNNMGEKLGMMTQEFGRKALDKDMLAILSKQFDQGLQARNLTGIKSMEGLLNNITSDPAVKSQLNTYLSQKDAGLFADGELSQEAWNDILAQLEIEDPELFKKITYV